MAGSVQAALSGLGDQIVVEGVRLLSCGGGGGHRQSGLDIWEEESGAGTCLLRTLNQPDEDFLTVFASMSSGRA